MCLNPDPVTSKPTEKGPEWPDPLNLGFSASIGVLLGIDANQSEIKEGPLVSDMGPGPQE